MVLGYIYRKINRFISPTPVIKAPPIVPEPKTKESGTQTETKKSNVFLVLDRGSQSPIGIFSTLVLAKLNGEKATYNNCIIIPYRIDDRCSYTYNSVFESSE